MRTLLCVVLLGIGVAVLAQQPSQKFEPATITSVKEHANPAMKEDGTGRQYRVGLRTATRNFVVLYTPPYGSKTVEYSVGNQVSILVGKKSIRFSDISGKTSDMPILSSNKLQPKAIPH